MCAIPRKVESRGELAICLHRAAASVTQTVRHLQTRVADGTKPRLLQAHPSNHEGLAFTQIVDKKIRLAKWVFLEGRNRVVQVEKISTGKAIPRHWQTRQKTKYSDQKPPKSARRAKSADGKRVPIDP